MRGRRCTRSRQPPTTRQETRRGQGRSVSGPVRTSPGASRCPALLISCEWPSLLLLCRRRDFLLQIFLEEGFRAIPDRDPALVEQRLVCVVRHHEQFIRHVVRAEELDEPDRLREVHVAIVVSVNQEYGRLPVV